MRRPQRTTRATRASGRAGWAVALGLLLLLLAPLPALAVDQVPPGATNVRDFGARGDGQTDDSAAIREALGAAPQGGTVYLPAGNYRVTQSLDVKSGLVVQGAGAASRVFRLHSSGVNIFTVFGKSDVVIRDLRIDSDDSTGGTSVGIQVSGSSRVTLERLTFDRLGYALKLDGGRGSNTGITVRSIDVLQAWTPMYVSYTNDSTFRDLRLEAYRTPPDTKPHNVYLSAGNHRQVWENVLLTGGRSYAFQLYNGDPATSPSDSITVRNLTMSEVQQGIAVGNGFKGVLFEGVRGASSRFGSDMGWLDLQRDDQGGYYGGVVLRGFQLAGGALVSSHDSSGGRPGPVTLADGVIYAPTAYLPDAVSDTISSVTRTNVRVDARLVDTVGSPDEWPRTLSSQSTGPLDVVAGDYYYDAVLALSKQGIVSGYADGSFRPYERVQRAQLSKMVVGLLGIHTPAVEKGAVFSDMPAAGTYPYDYVQEAYTAGVVRGLAGGTFAPYAGVNRVQTVLMLVRAGGSKLQMPPSTYATGFTDVAGLSSEAKRAIQIARYNGIMQGVSRTDFAPYRLATRGQATVMLHSLAKAMQ